MVKRYYGHIKSTKEIPTKHQYKALKLDNIIDLSLYKPPVINQLVVGRCTGCGIGGSLSGKMSQLGLNPNKIFYWSPDDIYNGARVLEGTLNQDAGAEPVDCYTWIQKYGVLPYADMPITPVLSTVDPSTLEYEAVILPAFTPTSLNTDPNQILQEILDAMQAGYFVTIGAPYFAIWENYTGGMQPLCQATDPVAGGHEEFFYFADTVNQYFKRQNSWGTDDFGQNNPDPDKGCEYIPFAQIPILAQMGIDVHYANFTAPGPNPTPPPPPVPPHKCCLSLPRFLRRGHV